MNLNQTDQYRGWGETEARADYRAKHNGQDYNGSGGDVISDSVNKYVEELIASAGGKRDLILRKLDAEHKLALGSDDGQTAAFLESVSDALETKIGRIPYDYQRYTDRELADYALGKTEIEQTKQLALAKLSNDEKIEKQRLGLSQKTDNRSLTEDLNSRGMLDGQNPTEILSASGANGVGGLTGVAGQSADILNSTYAQQFGAIDTTNELGKRGINEGATRDMARLGFESDNRIEDLRVDSRRAAQDTQNNSKFQRESANYDYDEQRKALERQRDELLRRGKQQSTTLTGKANGVLGY